MQGDLEAIEDSDRGCGGRRKFDVRLEDVFTRACMCRIRCVGVARGADLWRRTRSGLSLFTIYPISVSENGLQGHEHEGGRA